MNCKDPSKHRTFVRTKASDPLIRPCGCDYYPKIEAETIAQSVSPVVAAPNEDRFPR